MNIVDIKLNNIGIDVLIYHNNNLAATIPADGNKHRIQLETQLENTLMLKHNSDQSVEIESIEMFSLGKEKLRYFGTFNDATGQSYQSHVIAAGGNWTLDYKYPVFSWLHKVLNFGWLIEPDVT